jgi:hypothetical protein
MKYAGEYGNLLTDREGIVNSERVQYLRAGLLDPSLPLAEDCVNCPYRCGGLTAAL